jgi:hypothetical protein
LGIKEDNKMNIKELKKQIENLDDDVVVSATIDIRTEDEYYDNDFEISISEFNDDKNKCVFYISGDYN